MNLYYVESPSQFICAIESIYLNEDHSRVFIRLNGQANNDTQIMETVEFYQGKIDFTYVYINGFFEFLLRFFPRALLSKRQVFIGCHKSKYVRFLSLFKSAYTLLDDGIASVIYIYNGGKNKIFTCLDLGLKNNLKIHRFDFLKKQAKNKKTGDQVVFFGAKYVEVGIIELGDYIRVLDSVASKEENILYIAHRAESDENLVKYEQIGIKVIRWERPSEIEIVLGEKSPKCIYGLYSAALITSKKILPHIPVYSIKSSSINVDNEVVDIIYDLMEKHDVKVLNMQ